MKHPTQERFFTVIVERDMFISYMAKIVWSLFLYKKVPKSLLLIILDSQMVVSHTFKGDFLFIRVFSNCFNYMIFGILENQFIRSIYK